MIVRCPKSIVEDDLVLRRITLDDLAAFTRFLMDREATRFMSFTDAEKSASGARGIIDHVVASYGTDKEVLALAIAEPSSGVYLGSVGGQASAAPNAIEIYFAVLPEHQRKGLATRATRLLIAYLFSLPGTSELRADVVRENRASLRVLEKLGFRLVGDVGRDTQAGDLEGIAPSRLCYRLDVDTWRGAASGSA